MRLRLLPLLALLGPALPAAAQSHTAYFDDFTYRAAGAPVDAPAADAFFGASRWLTGADGSTEVMRSWRLGGDDATFTGPPAAYWHGPATVSFVGQGAERALRLTLEAGYPHGDGVLVPTLSSGQAFAPTGTFAARVRLSALEAGQRMIEAFWIDSADEFRFCPPAEPACDARTGTAGTLGYWSEADFEFNNWFLHELGPSVSVGTGAYRHYGGDFEGGRSGPLDCRQGLGRVLRPLCRDGAGRSLFADRWVLLIYQLDPGRVVREGADAYAGAISFIARSDEPGRPGAFEAVPRADAREGIPGLEGVPAVWRSVGQAAEANSDYEARPISLYPRDGLSIRISLHYDGRTGEVACPRDAEGREVTCRPHTMEVDWVYHSPDVLSPEEVVAEVEGWRARR
ncbi:MAG TPA: hypothetical protein VK610_00380, partial [Rhodothermales bacterium]|nr:hypothetical protein [Rhodothermales bacterium]